ncbi:hypothetical protein CPC_A0205 [Clostridium perfringens C str. JGS1495]|uniref:Uncharacterized protein n=1 Tax=Clostridium perfringens B str. ATCC 3626 TaxID=451754 RepID=A0AAV3BPH6_CLOPF|nr:hypothetical protein CPC_A0205 [Clostridium perfringens C str. JGS1495]EDT23016.1 hypothetical protein AC1_A0463 [Clostridium perfringens B str. ATCC 3626]
MYIFKYKGYIVLGLTEIAKKIDIYSYNFFYLTMNESEKSFSNILKF